MELQFTKMQGAGNDYIYINGFDYSLDAKQAELLAIQLADRHFGIGGDGLVIIDPAPQADARMRMYNADGSEGRMCGNAIRCVAKYIYDHQLTQNETVLIDTLSGIKTIDLSIKQGKVTHATVDMGPANYSLPAIPVLSEEATWINHPYTTSLGIFNLTAVSMGNPHIVTFMKDIASLDLPKIGPVFELDPIFPERINTEFVVVHSPTEISMRVWERGSGETLACGTGACAAVAASIKNGFCPSNTWITVHLLGGDLAIYYSDETVYMHGEAVEVFKGIVDVAI
ncbi:diaminopimelate epimerase [Chryseomicrobium sp. FSL W7-1435]|uniref:diaminopimelate epimerase n=1 Tax=Chryseomicrobium sp. FSL W7-1435 TaxID=2921704 RepID=UPI00315AC12D